MASINTRKLIQALLSWEGLIVLLSMQMSAMFFFFEARTNPTGDDAGRGWSDI